MSVEVGLSEITSKDAVTATLCVVAIVSLLGERAGRGAVRRSFNGRNVLVSTLGRLALAGGITSTVVLAWDDQIESLRIAAAGAIVRSQGARKSSRPIVEAEASLRWSDGWRGGLLGKSIFDRGFDAAATMAAIEDAECDAAIVIDAAAALIEPDAIDRLIAHLTALPEQAYAFAPGAIGSGAMLLRKTTVEDLVKHKRGPGSLLTYHPDRPLHDPASKSFAIAVAPRVARSLENVAVDSQRQSHRLSLIQAGDAESVVAQLEGRRTLDALPRDVVIELTPRRATKPVWSLRDIERRDLSFDAARQIFDQLAEFDDVRVTFAGVGDPLLHSQWQEIVAAAKSAGIDALHLETDLLPDDLAAIDALAASDLDVVSFHLPAAHAVTYARLMGGDRMRDVLENVRRFLVTRNARDSGVPILVPTFVKCADNLGEMEAWYDQWIRAVGAAVITAPSDLSGRVAYAGIADMTAGRRRPCRRLRSRLTILSDGTIASCEEDVRGEQLCGRSSAIKQSWADGFAMLRSLHEEHRWDESELCKSCRMWDRP